MLNDAKSQAVYNALKTSGGFASTAADKASVAVGKVTAAKSQMDRIVALADSGVAGMVPPEITSAIAQVKSFKSSADRTGKIAAGLSDAIGQRMGDITGNLATMNVAASVAQKMGDVAGGCGALGAAFSVLTSEGRTELLNAALGGLEGELSALEKAIADGIALGTPTLPDNIKAALDSALSSANSLIGEMEAAADEVKALVDEAQQMWGKLHKAFNEAIQSSILMNVFNNPCLMAVVDTVAPPAVSDVLNNFKP